MPVLDFADLTTLVTAAAENQGQIGDAAQGVLDLLNTITKVDPAGQTAFDSAKTTLAAIVAAQQVVEDKLNAAINPAVPNPIPTEPLPDVPVPDAKKK